MPTPNPVVQWIADNHAELVTKIARREHRGIRTIEVEDVEQHVWLTLAKKSLQGQRHGYGLPPVGSLRDHRPDHQDCP